MRIGFDAKRAYSNSTGLGNYSRYTINALCRHFPENEYFLYTPSSKNETLFSAPEDSCLCLPDSIWSKQLKGYWRTYGLTKRLKKDTIELFHGLSNEIPVGIEKSDTRSVVTMHDLIFLRLPKLYKPIDRRIYEVKSTNAVKSANRIIAISKQTKNDLVELLHADEEKIDIVYQGCNPWFYKKLSSERLDEIRSRYSLPKYYLLYVGTIEERKNLLDIIIAIHQNNIDIPLVVVGNQSSAYYQKVRQYIEDKKIKYMHFHQYVANNDLPGFYQNAEAFVYPSSYEGFGIPVLEALNSGIPVITSKGGCLEETAGKGGLFINAGNIDELGDAIRNIISDTTLRNNMIEAGSRHALNFREEKTIPQLINIYKKVLG